MMFNFLIIKLLSLFFNPVFRSFQKSLEDPKLAQKNVQKLIFKQFQSSGYGQSFNLQSVEEWNQIPIIDYEDIKDSLEVLSPEPILFYEKTSGSRSFAKRIPYTQALRQSFNRMFCVWADDLLKNIRFKTGKVYFCLSPKLGECDIISDDSQYLSLGLRWLLKPFLVTVPNLENIRDPEVFKKQLALTLLAEEKLEIISIWNPTFLTVHLDYIGQHRAELLKELGDRASPQRRQLLQQDPIPWTQLWPHLKLISCWDSAQAKIPADYLRSSFPGVLVQGKGLLATEAPMTLPLQEAGGCVPLLDEVFFEFLDEAGQIRLLHELQPDHPYELIISQQGGLYRYRMGDRVRMTHSYHHTPCLEFLGRTAGTSDLVGEKLHEDFVMDLLHHLSLPPTGFQTLVPVLSPHPHYILLLDRGSAPGAIAQALENALQQSYHYRQARLLGQLHPAQVWIIPQISERFFRHLGKRWGDIKPTCLYTQPLDPVFLKELNALASIDPPEDDNTNGHGDDLDDPAKTQGCEE